MERDPCQARQVKGSIGYQRAKSPATTHDTFNQKVLAKMASTSSTAALPSSYLNENVGYRLVDTAIAFIVIQTFFVALRAWARRFRSPSWMFADIFVPIAYLCSLAIDIVGILIVKHGAAGRHVEAVMQMKPLPLPYFFKTLYIAIPVLYCLAVTFPKLALLDVYLHIFIDRFSRYTCYITGLVIILTMVVNVPTTIRQCSPVSYLWDQYVDPDAHGHCNNIQTHFLWASFPNILTDVVMLFIPIPVLRKLQISFKTKLGIFATFLVGSIGLVVSIIRFAAFTQSYTDFTRVSVALTVWTTAEPGAYVVAARLITLRPLLSYIAYESPLSSVFTASILTTSRKSTRLNETGKSDTFHSKRKETSHDVELPECSADATNLVPGDQYPNSSMVTAEQVSSRGYPESQPAEGIHVEHEFMFSSKPAKERSPLEPGRPGR
ncbi:hypothetical protein EV356DRAFT_504513 [Viridothelium virens]|uniref:Rhodopsin domain-containing protein n=1 Tax=Viridothelium virens TaxID=1048519 RepID=A0A6A6H4U7_VIRVR|nr:hypothetical protein EV356DRAFT_504513 [Viridothelium virens]